MAIFEDGGWRVERWYRFHPQPFSPPKSVSEAREELFDIYKRALKRQLISDVPVGLLLSGGIDSGLLLGLMSLYGEGWPTYTVGYGKSAYKNDELSDAAETARIFSANHTAVELSRQTFEQCLANIVSALEEPVEASSIVPMYFVCRRAREDVKVALVGQGPDELFGGYTRHLGVRYGDYWRRLPRWLQSGVQDGVDRLPRNQALKRGVYGLATDDRMHRYRNVFSILPGPTVDGLFRDGMAPDEERGRLEGCWAELEPFIDDTDELGGFQALEIRSSLPDKLLMYADKLSMAHGLEVRVPYLDREIVEYVERLPAAFKVRRGQRKWLHKKVCERFLPRSILTRKKRGFAVDVVDDWFQNAVGGNMDRYLLDGSSLMFDYLKPAAVKRLLDDHRSGRSDNYKALFNLVVLEEWLRSNRSAAVAPQAESVAVAAAS